MEHDPAGRGGERGGVSLAAPQVVVIGGPNGAGKTTVSKTLVPKFLTLGEFVNADVIASGLSGFAPERAAFAAGRVMMTRLRELAQQRANFAFETTMASRTFVPWLRTLAASGYEVHLVYVWLRSVALAQRRVRMRISAGGHSVPPDVIARRYYRGLRNFLHDYTSVATTWRVYDNSGIRSQLVGMAVEGELTIFKHAAWASLQRKLTDEDEEPSDLPEP